MAVYVSRYKRKSNYSNPQSPDRYYLKHEPGAAKTCDIEDVAKEIQEISSLSVGDVTHTLYAFVGQLRKVLVRGDKVKIDGLGTFYTTLTCAGAETEKEAVVRNIKSVNIRFLVDKRLRLVNNAIATSRSDNNVTFAVKSDTPCDCEPVEDNDDDDGIDPGV